MCSCQSSGEETERFRNKAEKSTKLTGADLVKKRRNRKLRQQKRAWMSGRAKVKRDRYAWKSGWGEKKV